MVPTGGAGFSHPCAGEEQTGKLFWATLCRLSLLYFLPLVLLGIFFSIEYTQLVRDSHRAHLQVVAEQQGATFDLFLRERLVNLDNVVDDAGFEPGAGEGRLRAYLASMQQTSDAFVDLGVVSANGDLVSYVGPVRYPPGVNYGDDTWFRELMDGRTRSVITEIYLGVRGRPHFTIAVRRGSGSDALIVRSALSPERLAEYLTTLEGATEVRAAIVNAEGILQVATAREGGVLRPSGFVPPSTPARGFVAGARRAGRPDYAYAWLRETPWALVVTNGSTPAGANVLSARSAVFLATAAILALAATIILVRARQVVRSQVATEQQQAELSGQLVHAARLASVGELAAGIAHEINNPLAVVAEEVGVLQDALDPDLADDEPLDVSEHLAAIREAVFRCRDITRKLLTFVRQTEVRVEQHELHDVLDDVLDTMLGNELAISNVTVVRRYDEAVGSILTDRNQLVQVLVNLVKNAIDAMPRGGTLTITTEPRGENVAVLVRDTGVGMTREQREQVFAPFFTTKDPGQGTGLGLSVSYSIIRDFGGSFYVDSAPGRGSTFTIELPRMAGREIVDETPEVETCSER